MFVSGCIIENVNQIPAIEALRKAREQVGFILTPIDTQEARFLEPLLSERILGALFNPLDGGTNPFQLMVALNRKAIQLGAKVFYHAEVQDIKFEDGRVKSVVTDKGVIRTNTVINACGSWASFIGKMVGIKIPIIPNEMEFVVNEQLPPMVSHIIMGASYLTEEYSKDEMITNPEKFGTCLCIHQTVSGNLLLGATWRFVGYDKRTS